MWVDQLYGNPALQEKIAAMEDGQQIELEVEGVRGIWSKITAHGRGKPRPGVKPSGDAIHRWLALRDEKYAGIASVRDCSADPI